MKIKIVILLMLISCYAWADSVVDSAVNFYAQKFGHEHPDEIMYATLDFNGPGPVVILTSSYGYYDKMQGYTWTVMELKNGSWSQPKTRQANGDVFNGGVILFEPSFAGFVFLKKFNQKGILAYFPRGKYWAFTYLDKADDTLKTVTFGKASEVNMEEEALTKLRDSAKIEIERKAVN